MRMLQLQIVPGKFLLDFHHSSSEGFLGSLNFWLNSRGTGSEVKESDLWAYMKSDSARGLSQRQVSSSSCAPWRVRKQLYASKDETPSHIRIKGHISQKRCFSYSKSSRHLKKQRLT